MVAYLRAADPDPPWFHGRRRLAGRPKGLPALRSNIILNVDLMQPHLAPAVERQASCKDFLNKSGGKGTSKSRLCCLAAELSSLDLLPSRKFNLVRDVSNFWKVRLGALLEARIAPSFHTSGFLLRKLFTSGLQAVCGRPSASQGMVGSWPSLACRQAAHKSVVPSRPSPACRNGRCCQP